jgi:hypothetical protein
MTFTAATYNVPATAYLGRSDSSAVPPGLLDPELRTPALVRYEAWRPNGGAGWWAGSAGAAWRPPGPAAGHFLSYSRACADSLSGSNSSETKAQAGKE